MVGHPKHPRGPGEPGQAQTAPPARDADGERVAKTLARAGVASRREVERLIELGRVAVNGQVLVTPAVKIAANDVVTVDGAVISAAEPTRVFRYHKPAGLMTTHNDPKGRPTVFQALPPDLPRVISIGRLDLASEGLLLLTNDGALSRALEMPASGWMRRYRVRAHGRIDQAKLDTLKSGITVEGVRYGAVDATLDKAKDGPSGSNVWITVTLTEGKNREIRRVFEALGLAVNRLVRLAYGPFALGTLEPGAVEEVGPRVIREQLVGLVAAANMPLGDRAAFKPAAGVGAARRAAGSKAMQGNTRGEPLPAITYKPGWARPKKKPVITPKASKPRRRKPG